MAVRCARRAVWIAVGALSVHYFDLARGASRRQRLSGLAAAWFQRLRDRRPARIQPDTPGSGEEQLGDWSVTKDLARARASAPLAEEVAAGVPTPAPAAMAEQIMAESEARIVDRATRSWT